MEKKSKTFFIPGIFPLVSLIIFLPFENNLSKSISNNEIEVSQLFQYEKSGQVNIEPVIFDDFELIEGLEIADLKGVRDSYRRRRVIQLGEGSKKGHAENYFFEKSAKYDITLFYVDGIDGKSEVDIFINSLNIGNITFGLSNSFKEKTIPGINIRQWSKITLEFAGDGKEKCRIVKLVFTPAGAFEGKVGNLAKPQTLRIFETANEQLMGRRVFTDFVRTRNDSLEEKRKSELAGLKNAAEWRARQKKTRERLDKILGKFPERTPLNARITGKLERDHYTIEKVIFESQPKYYVTANLYIPKGRRFPVPGVLFTCGHSEEGKALKLYHETCLGLVLKGYVVLAFDPLGQGERSEYFDAETNKPLVDLTVSQHLYMMRPAFLVDWSLAGLRTWDGIRAVDYLVSRPEIDTTKLAVVGNSGGGQMTLLITAADERIKVCAAAHPGGECENTYLLGQDLFDKEILSLIPPRPVRIIVGRDSGEEQSHRPKLEDMQLFNEGLGNKKDRCELVLVDGVHNMEHPSPGFGRTTLGMRTLDVIKGIDFLNSRDDLKGRKIVMVGEGLGGLWALLASIYDSRIDGVVTVGTLPSYMLLVKNQYYNVLGYFWVPGALRDFDIPDLARLVSPKPQIWIDPVDALGENLDFAGASPIIGSYKNLNIITPDQKPSRGILQLFNTIFN